MKKIMILAAAVLFSTAIFAQAPKKHDEKKEPAKTEQKTAMKETKTATKPAEHKTAATPQAKQSHNQAAEKSSKEMKTHK